MPCFQDFSGAGYKDVFDKASSKGEINDSKLE